MAKTSDNTTSERIREKIETAADATKENVRDGVNATAQDLKAQTQTGARKAANAASAAADEFDAGTLQAQAAQQVANGLEHVVDTLRHTDMTNAVSRATGFARENPALVLGGAALAGFALARFLKSSAPANGPSKDADIDPWTGHVSATDPAPVAPARPSNGDDRAYGTPS